MKSTENHLRSWRPRRPSATLEWRLMLAHAARVPRMLRVAGWLTPATVCALLALLALDVGNTSVPGGPRGPSAMAMLSNENYVVSATSRQSQQNNLSVFTSDWTNLNGSGSTLRFTPFREQTN